MIRQTCTQEGLINMIIDNRAAVRKILETRPFTNDSFLFGEVLARKKDASVFGENKHIRSFTVSSLEDYDNHTTAFTLADATGARVYLNLNRRSHEKVAFAMLSRLSANLGSRNYRLTNMYNSVVASTPTESEKLWFVDLDTTDSAVCDSVVSAIRYYLTKIGYTIDHITALPTVSGFHVVTPPFNLGELERDKLDYLSPSMIKKDSLVLLYANTNEP
jgi:hypothetical protein